MSYAWVIIEHAFFVRWKQLTVPDLDRILRDVQNARRATGKPIVYVSITPEDLPVPTALEREALKDFAANARESCEVVHLVIEGNSINHTMQRTAITALMWLMQQKSTQLLIHKSFDVVLKQVTLKINRTPEDVLRLLRARQILPAS